MQIIIPMSGIGKRFIDAGYKVPKFLIEVENKPIIEHVIDLFPDPDNNFIFIVNNEHTKTTNIKNILLNKVKNCKIIEVDVNNRKGPVHAVMLASEYIDDNQPTIVSYCDFGTLWNYSEFKEKIKNYDGAIACYKNFHPHMLGTDNYAFVKETNNIMEKIQEKKPFTNNRMNEYASNGIYYFKSGAIIKKYFNLLMEKNIQVNNEFYVSEVYNLMKEDNLNIYIYEIEKMLQWGTPKDLEEYLLWSNYFLKREEITKQSNNILNKTTLILPMAGKGSRFFIEGYTIPKPLLPIENKYMFIKAIDDLPYTNKKIFITQKEHNNKYKIDNIINKIDNSKIIEIDYITDGQATSCDLAFKNNLINLDEPILISACDNGVYYDMEKYLELINDETIDIIVWSFSNNPTSKLYPHMYAWLDVDENNFIKRVSVKKAFSDCENKYAIIGTMFFRKASYYKTGLQLIYDSNIKTNNEYYVDNMIEPLINKGYKVKIFNVDNYLCWGTPNDYKTYNYWYEYFIK